MALVGLTINLSAEGGVALQSNMVVDNTNIQSESMRESKNAVLALNYLHASLNKIKMYNDKRVLEDEYDNIINNINLTAIDDKEIVDIITELMDTLTKHKLTEMEKEKLQREYQEKLDTALSNSLLGVSDKTIGTTIVHFAKKGTEAVTHTLVNPLYVVQVANSTYKDYQNTQFNAKNELDKSQWKLKKDTVIQLNNARKKFLLTYWKIMKRYNIPDNWRITEKQLTRFVNVIKGTDEKKKYRQLLRMKNELAMLPTFWFELSLAAHSLGEKNEELFDIKKYESLNQKLLRHNAQYSLMLANSTVYLDTETQKKQIEQILEKIQRVDPRNPERKLFVAMEYAIIGNLQKTEKLLDENIDDGFLLVLSKKMKIKLFIKLNQAEAYKSTINDLLEKQKLSVLENLAFLGEFPVESLVKVAKQEINNIGIIIKKSLYGKDHLVVALPKQWVLRDIDDAKLFLKIEKDEIKADSVEVEDEFLVYTYKSAILEDDLKEKKVKQIILKLIYKEIPTEIIYDIHIEKLGIDIEENNESNESSFLKSLYSKSAKAYAEYRSEIKFIPSKIKMSDKCFDVINNLKPCAR
jgi:hypothetical protein